MQSDAVAFEIDNHGAKTMRPNLLPFLQTFSAILSRRFDCFIQAAFDQKINQRSICRGRVVDAGTVAANAETTGRILFFVRQKAVFCSTFG
jgi:hypothetical protein